MMWCARALIGVISLALFMSALAKVVSGYSEEVIWPEWVYYSFVMVELILVGLLQTSRWRSAMFVVAAMMLVGIGVTVFLPEGSSCGCWGALGEVASNRVKLLLSTVLGFLACYAMSRRDWDFHGGVWRAKLC